MLTPNLITNALVPLVRDRQEEQKSKEDQTNHRDTRILTWKTLQCEGKNHGHQPATTFTIFMECLQERCDMFWQLRRGSYSKTLIHTSGAPPAHPRASPEWAFDQLQGIWIIIQHQWTGTWRVGSSSLRGPRRCGHQSVAEVALDDTVCRCAQQAHEECVHRGGEGSPVLAEMTSRRGRLRVSSCEKMGRRTWRDELEH
jgi:hypothetical protein